MMLSCRLTTFFNRKKSRSKASVMLEELNASKLFRICFAPTRRQHERQDTEGKEGGDRREGNGGRGKEGGERTQRREVQLGS
jgi:hypothetical protein